MSINFHGRPNTGMADGFGEGGQIKVGIVLVLDVIMGHISMPQAVHSNIVSQANLLADLTMTLAGTTADTTAKGKIGRSETAENSV